MLNSQLPVLLHLFTCFKNHTLSITKSLQYILIFDRKFPFCSFSKLTRVFLHMYSSMYFGIYFVLCFMKSLVGFLSGVRQFYIIWRRIKRSARFPSLPLAWFISPFFSGLILRPRVNFFSSSFVQLILSLSGYQFSSNHWLSWAVPVFLC